MSPLLQRNPAIPSIVRKIKLYNDAATSRRKHSNSQDARVQNDLRPKMVMAVVLVLIEVMVTGGKIHLEGAVLIFTLVLISSKF